MRSCRTHLRSWSEDPKRTTTKGIDGIDDRQDRSHLARPIAMHRLVAAFSTVRTRRESASSRIDTGRGLLGLVRGLGFEEVRLRNGFDAVSLEPSIFLLGTNAQQPLDLTQAEADRLQFVPCVGLITGLLIRVHHRCRSRSTEMKRR